MPDLRAELAEAENRRRAAIEALTTERTTLENQLKQSQDERDKLQNEIASMKREVETTWASERMENAVLRERINDVAAEVARLTSVLEGPGSPIDAMLAGDAAAPPRFRWRRPRPPATSATAKAPGLARRPHPRAAKPRLAGAATEPRLNIARLATTRPNRRNTGALDSAAACLKSCPRTGRLAQRESVPFTRERS